MLVTPHFLVGAAVATKVPEAMPAALAVIVLHFVMDAIPHKDYLGESKLTLSNVLLVIGDTALALVLFFILVKPALWIYAFGIGVVAVSPDIVELPGHFWPKWKTLPRIKQLYYWHGQLLQYNRELPFCKESWPDWFWGLLPQIIITAALIYIIVA